MLVRSKPDKTCFYALKSPKRDRQRRPSIFNLTMLPRHMMRQLKDSGLCGKFPEDTLSFLELVTGSAWPCSTDLKTCLDEIRAAESQLEHDPRFRALRDTLPHSGHDLN